MSGHAWTAAEVAAALDELERLGVVRRWRCGRCDDSVPYRIAEMDEAESRRRHEAQHRLQDEA